MPEKECRLAGGQTAGDTVATVGAIAVAQSTTLRPNNSSPDVSLIEQLAEYGCRFPVFDTRTKGPLEPGWQLAENGRTAAEAIAHVLAGGNAGLQCGSGDVYFFDLDNLFLDRIAEFPEFEDGVYVWRDDAPHKGKAAFVCREKLTAVKYLEHDVELLAFSKTGGHGNAVIAGVHVDGARIRVAGHVLPELTADQVHAMLDHWTDGAHSQRMGSEQRRTTVPAVAAPPVHRNGNHVYAEAALRYELDALEATLEGGRNDALNRAAFNLGQFMPHELDEAEVFDVLLTTALAIGLGKAESVRTIASGLAAGIADPRGVPAPFSGGSEMTMGGAYDGFGADTSQPLPGVNVATPDQIGAFIAATKELTGPAREAALGVLRTMLAPLSEGERQACESPLYELFRPPNQKRQIEQFLASVGPAEGDVHRRFPFLRDVPAEVVEGWLEEWRQADAIEGGRSYGAWEFVDAFADGEEARAVVPGLLPRGEVWTIAGKAGTGKSWLHARLAPELATGGPFLGRYDCEPGRVLCCLTEGKAGWARRLRSHLDYFQSGRDVCNVFVRDNLPQLIEPQGFGQKAAGGLDWFLHIRRDMWAGTLPAALDLVLIDYLREASMGAAENSNDDMSLVLRASNQLARALQCGVVLFHHQGADETKAGRGATVVRDMSYALAVLSGDLNKGADSPVKLAFDKSPKDAAEPAPVFMTLDTDWPGYPILTYVDHEDDLSKQIYELLRYDFPGAWMTHTALAQELIPPDGVTVDAWKERVRRACLKMRQDVVNFAGIEYEPGRSKGYRFDG